MERLLNLNGAITEGDCDSRMVCHSESGDFTLHGPAIEHVGRTGLPNHVLSTIDCLHALNAIVWFLHVVNGVTSLLSANESLVVASSRGHGLCLDACHQMSNE